MYTAVELYGRTAALCPDGSCAAMIDAFAFNSSFSQTNIGTIHPNAFADRSRHYHVVSATMALQGRSHGGHGRSLRGSQLLSQPSPPIIHLSPLRSHLPPLFSYLFPHIAPISLLSSLPPLRVLPPSVPLDRFLPASPDGRAHSGRQQDQPARPEEPPRRVLRPPPV